MMDLPVLQLIRSQIIAELMLLCSLVKVGEISGDPQPRQRSSAVDIGGDSRSATGLTLAAQVAWVTRLIRSVRKAFSFFIK